MKPIDLLAVVLLGGVVVGGVVFVVTRTAAPVAPVAPAPAADLSAALRLPPRSSSSNSSSGSSRRSGGLGGFLESATRVASTATGLINSIGSLKLF